MSTIQQTTTAVNFGVRVAGHPDRQNDGYLVTLDDRPLLWSRWCREADRVAQGLQALAETTDPPTDRGERRALAERFQDLAMTFETIATDLWLVDDPPTDSTPSLADQAATTEAALARFDTADH